MGPIATAYFYELMIKMTDARIDQEHIEMLIFSKPSIPDRTQYILGKSSKNPLPDMIEIGKQLAGIGADHIAIPCITAHYFHDMLTQGIPAPIINVVSETALHLKDHNIRCAGIMATEGTIHSGLFQQELEKVGIEAVIPGEKQQEDITHLIYRNVKANQPVEIEKFHAAAGELQKNGAEVIILGCTELSLIKRDYDIGPGYIDAMEVLAKRSIELCQAKLKDEYRSLITKL